MPKTLKAVVVGAGWSAEGHTKAFQHYGVEVVVLCGRTPEIVRKVAAHLDVAEASTDWRESLLKHKPDIVALTTPATLRVEVIELAVDLGCHIICEKPLALTAEAAGSIYNLIKDTGLKHGFAATHLYDPSVAYVHQLLVRQKAIGTLKEIDIGQRRRIANTAPRKTIKPWNWMTSLAHGGGILNNGLTHRLGMLERMTGMKIVSAVGEARTVIREAPVVPEIRDFRVWVRKELTVEEASEFEWRVCDAETDFSALFWMVADPNKSPTAPEKVLVTMGSYPGLPTAMPDSGWYFYGSQGMLIGEGRHILTPITLYNQTDSQTLSENIEDTARELTVPQQLTEALPHIGDDIQNKWVALVRDFLADIEDRPHEPYLTFQDGWRYQIAIDAIRESKGWTQIPS